MAVARATATAANLSSSARWLKQRGAVVLPSRHAVLYMANGSVLGYLPLRLFPVSARASRLQSATSLLSFQDEGVEVLETEARLILA